MQFSCQATQPISSEKNYLILDKYKCKNMFNSFTKEKEELHSNFFR